MTLSGRVPPDATSFRWACDLTFATYSLSVASADPATAEIVWLDGGEQSRPLALVRLPAPPTRWQVAGTDVGRKQFLSALVAFNVGVEAGQNSVIAAAMVLVGHWAANRDVYRRLVVVPGSAAIALIGLFWTVERLAL